MLRKTYVHLQFTDFDWAAVRSFRPAEMKKTLAGHRRVVHPGWKPPERKLGEAYRLDYSTRARQF